MFLSTTRFGHVDIEPSDILTFPQGIVGLEECRSWIVLADTRNDFLGWMQSVTNKDVAMAVVAPARFVPQYRVRTTRRDLAPLQLDDSDAVQILAIVGRKDDTITLNLRAPILINVNRRTGCQIVAGGDQPLDYVLPLPQPNLRRSA